MSLVSLVDARDRVTKICSAIDAGELVLSDAHMLALAAYVSRCGPPVLVHDLLVMLASRCESGRRYLKDIAQ